MFQYGVCRHLKFLKYKSLTVKAVKRVGLRHRAEFRRNYSNCGEIWRFFDFSKWVVFLVDFQNFKFWTVRSVEIELRRDAKFFQCYRTTAEIWHFFRFFNMAAAAILNISNFKRLWRLRGSNCVTAPNFIDITWAAAEACHFYFRMAATAILDVRTFYGRSGQETRTASSCHILSKSLKLRLRYGDF